MNFGGSHERALNNYCHHQFQESLALETMVTNDGDCVDNLYKGNLMEYCVMNMTLINWDDEPRDSDIFRNITVEDNMAFYCGFESLYNLDTIKTRKDGNRAFRILKEELGNRIEQMKVGFQMVF